MNKQTSGMWAIAAHKNTDEIEMFDQKDISIDSREFTKQTGLDPRAIVDIALGPVHSPVVQSSRNNYKDIIEKLTKLFKDGADKNRPEIENLLLYSKDGILCAQYIELLHKELNQKPSDIPKPIQLYAVSSSNSAVIAHIENPDEEIQMAAVNNNGDEIEHIANPSEAVKMAAVNNNGLAIQYIKNPSEAVQMAAVNNIGFAIEFIKNPSEAVIDAVKVDGDMNKVYNELTLY